MFTYLVVCSVAALISTLALLTGFGLGTVLMPTLALFFPVPVAVAATALVHLANNVFKVALVGRYADRAALLQFAPAAAAAAITGAALLTVLDGLPPLGEYVIGGQVRQISWIKLMVAVVIMVFAAFDLLPLWRPALRGRHLILGGLLSGFFGGLSGHQGALRSAFLIKADLAKEAFVGTNAAASIIVDVARLLVYGLAFYTSRFSPLESESNVLSLVAAASAAAFLGSFLGSRLLGKTTLSTLRVLVGGLLILVALGMGIGLL